MLAATPFHSQPRHHMLHLHRLDLLGHAIFVAKWATCASTAQLGQPLQVGSGILFKMNMFHVLMWSVVTELLNVVCDRLWINQPFTTKWKFLVQANIYSIQDAIHRFCVYVIDGIYPLLCTFWKSFVHELCTHSSKTKQLVFGLFVNGVQIQNWKRTFSNCTFSTVLHSQLYNLRTSRMGKSKTILLLAIVR